MLRINGHKFKSLKDLYPLFLIGKYGLPRVDVALILGLCAGFMASIFESLGDYYACARMAGVPAPPKHAINRGKDFSFLCMVLSYVSFYMCMTCSNSSFL